MVDTSDLVRDAAPGTRDHTPPSRHGRPIR